MSAPIPVHSCPRCRAILGIDPFRPSSVPAHPSHTHASGPYHVTGVLCPIEQRTGERRDPKTQGWWLTGVLSRERRSGQDRRGR